MEFKRKTVWEMLTWLEEEGYSQKIRDVFEGVIVILALCNLPAQCF